MRRARSNVIHERVKRGVSNPKKAGFSGIARARCRLFAAQVEQTSTIVPPSSPSDSIGRSPPKSRAGAQKHENAVARPSALGHARPDLANHAG